MDETEDLKAYRINVERLAKLGSSEVFSNGQPEHAVIILETFFKFARERVVVFCQKLSQRTYGGSPLIGLVDQALRKNKVDVSIITQEAPESQDFIAAAKQWKGECLPISVGSVHPSSAPLKVNFAVMDHKGYRFEGNRDKPEAFACLNDPDIAESLLGHFSQIAQDATDLLPPVARETALQPRLI